MAIAVNSKSSNQKGLFLSPISGHFTRVTAVDGSVHRGDFQMFSGRLNLQQDNKEQMNGSLHRSHGNSNFAFSGRGRCDDTGDLE